MKRFRVVHVITSLLVGGAEMLLVALSDHLRARGYDSAVISLGEDDALSSKLEAIGVPVHMIGMRRGRVPRPSEIVRLRRLVRKHNPDVIQGWMAHGNLGASIAAVGVASGVPVLWSIHQTLGRYGTQPFTTRVAIRAMAAASRSVSRIIYVSRTSQIEHEAFGFFPGRGIHVPNGVDADLFVGGPERRKIARATLGLPDDIPLIGHVARFHPAKDQRTLIEALERVFSLRSDTQAVLIGRDLLPSNPQVAKWTKSSAFKGRLHLLGSRADVRELLPGLDVFCLSSAYGEACSVAMLEAMSCGVRCVVTDVADARWMLANTGGLVPAANPEALASELCRVLDMPEADAAAASARARTRVLETFSLTGMVDAYANIYQTEIDRIALAKKSKVANRHRD